MFKDIKLHLAVNEYAQIGGENFTGKFRKGGKIT